jgi:hypothetical protein
MLTNNDIPLEKRTDLDPAEKRFWRALIRVDSVDYQASKIGLVLPGWYINKVLYYDIKKMPELLLQEIGKGTSPNYRFHAPANIGAGSPEDIYIDIASFEID